jgi:methylsterol monooxygenase
MTVSNPLHLPERLWRLAIASLWILNPLLTVFFLPTLAPLRPYLPWSFLIDDYLRIIIPPNLREAIVDFALPVCVVRELVWFYFHVQYLVIAKFDLFQSYQNPHKERPPFETQWFIFDAMNVDHVIILPVVVLVCVVAYRLLSIDKDWSTIPPIWVILIQIQVARVVREFLRYWGHRAMHAGALYKYIHKKHHEFKYPFSLVGEYAHPVENLFHGVIPILSGLIAAWYLFGLHMVMIFADLFYATLLSVEEHTGYNLPWNHDYWPFLSWMNGGSLHHDMHHKDLNGNFGERWLDKLFGTDMETMRAKLQERLKLQAQL